jgi:TPR repeat protein
MLARHVVRAILIAALLGGAGCAAKPPPQATLAGVPAPSAQEMAAAVVRGQNIRCSWGLAEACMSVGDAYRYGLGVSADEVASTEYYRRACAIGATDGCVRVGIDEGNRRLRSMSAVVADTFEPACEKGSYWGCYLAGIALARDPEGRGSPSDIPRGRAYLERACPQSQGSCRLS